MTTKEKEIWRPVVGLEQYYSISSNGRVRREAPARGTQAGRILRFSKCHGYYQTYLYVNDVRKTYKVHKLVAAAFIGPRPEGLQVNHKDGVKTNNQPDNLEYVTPRENLIHAIQNNLCNHPKGEAHVAAKLTTSEVRQIKQLLASGKSQSWLSRMFQISRATIYDIATNKRWKQALPQNSQTDRGYEANVISASKVGSALASALAHAYNPAQCWNNCLPSCWRRPL